MTQREQLERALGWHGCKLVAQTAKGSQWTTGNLTLVKVMPGTRATFFFVGNSGGFRHGRSRSDSASWPKTRAKLLAERGPVIEFGEDAA